MHTDHQLGPAMSAGETALPPGTDLSDGLSADEAVSVALWNNAPYLATLSQLGITRAQLVEAGLLTDPQFVLFFPLSPKQLSERQKKIYLPRGRLGLIMISYVGSVSERSRRLLSSCISAGGAFTPVR